MRKATSLLSSSSASALSIKDIHEMYSKYVSSSQVDLISSFLFGNETVEYSEGCYIHTKQSNRILDLTGGIGVLNHGHNHPRILKVRKEFNEKKRMEVHKNFFSPYVAVLSHNIAQLLPNDLNISYFPNSGAEAVEGAMKMAYKYHDGKRKSILHTDISFHGKLLGAASITGSPELHFDFPKIPGSYSFKYDDIDSVVNLIGRLRNDDGSSDVYAIVVEPLNASSMRSCSSHFLVRLRELCDNENIILIFDEVYSGWGKTGHLFNFMRVDDLVPDIVTYAKSFGGGKSSISGYTARESVFRNAYDNKRDATLHSTTYYGFGEECVTAIEAVNIIVEEKFIEKSKEIGSRMSEGLSNISSKHSDLIIEVRGSGALWGVIINPGITEKVIGMLSAVFPVGLLNDKLFAKKLCTGAVISALYDKYKILSFFGSNQDVPLILSFPLVAGEDEVDYALSSLDSVFSLGMPTLISQFVINKIKK